MATYDAEMKDRCVAMAQKHINRDMLIAGAYVRIDKDRRWQGSSIGCANHEFGNAPDDHAALAESTGLPLWLINLQGALYDHTDHSVHLELYQSAPADLRNQDWRSIFHLFMSRTLREVVLPIAGRSAEAVEQVAALHDAESRESDDWIAGRTAGRVAARRAARALGRATNRVADRVSTRIAARDTSGDVPGDEDTEADVEADAEAERIAAWESAETAARIADRMAARDSARPAAEAATLAAGRNDESARDMFWAAALAASASAVAAGTRAGPQIREILTNAVEIEALDYSAEIAVKGAAGEWAEIRDEARNVACVQIRAILMDVLTNYSAQ